MKVELVSKTVGVNKYESLDSEEIVAAIARHGTIKDDNGKLIKYLMDHKHWSPLQHISFGFLIETRRSISAQIFRHTSLNGQESSTRYSEPVGYEEIELRREHPTNRQSSTDVFNPTLELYRMDVHEIKANDAIKAYLEQGEDLYKELLEKGVAKECARDILPLCTKTTIHVTGTLRDLLGFLNVRLDHHSQLEIRLIAERIGEELEQQLPNVFKTIDWENGMFM